jgi:hypothetical protein
MRQSTFPPNAVPDPRCGGAPLAIVLAVALGATGGARAYDINDKLSIGGALGVAGQCQAVAGLTDPDNLCRGFALGRMDASLQVGRGRYHVPLGACPDA